MALEAQMDTKTDSVNSNKSESKPSTHLNDVRQFEEQLREENMHLFRQFNLIDFIAKEKNKEFKL